MDKIRQLTKELETEVEKWACDNHDIDKVVIFVMLHTKTLMGKRVEDIKATSSIEVKY